MNFNNLRAPKRDMLWVAVAGPVANLVQALIWALVAKVLLTAGVDRLVGPSGSPWPTPASR